ncbi:MAG: sigma-70 family RNA polymerase sigma factor [Acidobacteriota bacterium]|nr:sigma-70 family RNA polymerase sigma factor [Acidobacteriota bacterium]
MNSASDEALVEACLAGNQVAWSALVARYKNLVYSVPVRYRMSADDAADVFQQVWLALFSELPNLRQTGALRSWLLTVAAHRCYHIKRRRQQREDKHDPIDDQIADSQLPLEWQKQVEKEQVFREAISRLPERCQVMVRLLFYEDPPLPYAEIAARLGLAEGSIGFIRGRCLKKLREQLEKMRF